MSLVENIHHYFLCFLALTHSFNFTTFSSSSSNHQARTSSKLFHLIFRNKTPKCKFNVIFFFIFCYVDTRDILYNMLYASPKNGFFNVHFGPEGVIIEIFLGTSNYLKVDFFFLRKKSMGNFNRWSLPMWVVKFCEDWCLSRFLSLQYLSLYHNRTIFLRIFHDLCFILFRE